VTSGNFKVSGGIAPRAKAKNAKIAIDRDVVFSPKFV
jgi:hypothetical protein